MTDCIFCKISAGDIPAKRVYEDDEVVAFYDVNPQAPTHVLVIPRRHVEGLLDDPGAELLGKLNATAIEVARRLDLDSSGFRVVTNCGADGGQEVFHLHLHLLGGRKLSWPPG